jgi:TPP-dependent pyruvate/acetoin dehydrogenase alpha subunit
MFDINKLAREIIRLRLSQLIVNERYKKNEFKIPIHLAMGHEAIAVAVSQNIEDNDSLILSHRNCHYNLAQCDNLKLLLNEYLLKKESIGEAKYGSMNLANPKFNIPYTSSILGNNLCVLPGVALGKKIKNINGISVVVTGDGAMEEGSFYECIEMLKTNQTPSIIIVENNGWSLATTIEQRRCPINMPSICEAFNVDYRPLKGNCVLEYSNELKEIKTDAMQNNNVICIEVFLDSLGGWYVESDQNSTEKRYINYHAGPAQETNLLEWPLLKNDENDPVYTLLKHIDELELKSMSKSILEELQENLK